MKENDLTLDQANEPSQDTYNEKMSFAAVGRLFDDDDKPTRPSPPLAEQPTAPVPASAPAPADPGVSERRAREEAALERPRRRDSATTRMLQSGTREEVMEAGFRDAQGDSASGNAPPRARERDRDKRRAAPEPRPAARANVEHAQAPAEGEEGFDAFRQRYNPDELVSVNRNPNRPVRPGQRPPRDRDEPRPPRQPANPGRVETLSPLRWVAAAAALSAVVIIIILFWQWRAAVGDAVHYRAELDRAHLQAAQGSPVQDQRIENLESTLELRDATVSNLEGVLEHFNIPYRNINQIPEDAPPPPPPGGNLAEPLPDGQVLSPTGIPLPTTHVVAPGQLMSHIAIQFFGPGNNNAATWDHIVATNIARHPAITRDRVLQGWELDILPLP